MTHPTTTTTTSSLSPPPHQMAKTKNPRKKQAKEAANHVHHQSKQEKPHSWALMRSFFTCKHLQAQLHVQQQQQQQQAKRNEQEEKILQHRKKQPKQEQQIMEVETNKKCKKMKCSGSLCNNTKVMHRPEQSSSLSPEEYQIKKRASSMGSINNGSTSSTKSPVKKANINNGASSLSLSSNSTTSTSINGGSLKGMPFRKLSGCYECRMVIDPVLMMTRDPSLKASICSCPQCGEIFMKAEYLELHQAVRHAVSELGPEDTSKNIVEIIFQSSWLKKQFPVCKIDRILKVHNTPKTISRFEEYRDSIKAKATKLPKKHPRCIADGNELLRFHCTTFMCSLGLNGSSNLCNSIPSCNVCSIIRHGFKLDAETKGILTTATSGKAHDSARVVSDDEKRAMLVCRVIAGRVKKNMEGSLEEYDSVGGAAGMYSNLDELYVFNPKAILPCFVVIYRGF